MFPLNKFSTYTKALLLTIVSTMLFIILFASLFYYIVKEERDIRQKSIVEFDKEVNSLLTLNSEPFLSIVSDVGCWDELVDFVQTKNQNWFEQALGSSLNVYKVDYLAVYDLKGNLLESKSVPKIISNQFITKEVFEKFGILKTAKFYCNSPEGIVEVFISTIHPTNDPLRNKTAPHGYFIIAKLMDINYFERLEKISGASIYLVNPNTKINIQNDKIEAAYQLRNWSNNAISKLKFSRKFNVDFKAAKNLFNIILLAFIINLLASLWFLRKWVYKPLLLIKGALESGNKRDIETLKNASGDFGHIGELFSENIKQRNQLIEAKIKAEESDRLKSSFLTNLSHEIRTPMNAVLGFSDLLKDNTVDDNTKQNYIKIINQSGTNLISIIDDLIEMSKIDANQITPNLTSINLDDFLNGIYHSVKITIPKSKNLQLIYKRNQKPLEYNIVTDEIKLRQVIINLISNAIKFTENGEVNFGYEIDDAQKNIKFKVKDTGIGIDEKNHNLIFDRFRRVDGDYSVKVGGLGLGLAISKSYVEMLGGTISLEKSVLGKGSEFWFTIPFNISAIETLDAQDKNILHTKNAGNKIILVAEDDNINFLLIEKIMLLKAHTIIRAKDGIEAISICKERNGELDLILMDIKMPKLSGYEALKEIKKSWSHIPVIAQTAYSTSDEVGKIKEAGFDNYISKPIKKDNLFELLDMYLS